MNYYVPFLPGEMYHVVSRATGNELLFKEQDNYRFFLRRFEKYISPVAEIYAYALLPNHFHFLIEIKPYEVLLQLCYSNKKLVPESKLQELLQTFVMQQFSNLLNSYSKAFNKKYNRKGSLFMDYLRRVQIADDEQFLATVFYIHKNPVHHGLCKNIQDWRWSSYNDILSDTATKIERQKITDVFEGREKFIAYHDQPIHLKNALGTEPED